VKACFLSCLRTSFLVPTLTLQPCQVNNRFDFRRIPIRSVSFRDL